MTAPGNRAQSHALAILESPGQLRLQTWVQMARTFTRMQRQVVVALAQLDLTLPQFDVLATLRFGEGVTQQELAARLLVTKGNVCGVLDRLENLGWVQRRQDAEDGRTNRIHLTAAGRRKIDVAIPKHDRLVGQAMRGFSDAEVKSLRRSLEQLDAAIGGE